MAIIEINFNPSDKVLRNFGRTSPVICLAVAVVLNLWKGLAMPWCLGLVCAGAAVFVCSLVSQKLTRRVFVGFSIITMPIGMAVNFVVLAVFFFLVLTPVGIVCRLIGHDPLGIRPRDAAESYWLERRQVDDKKRYFRQF